MQKAEEQKKRNKNKKNPNCASLTLFINKETASISDFFSDENKRYFSFLENCGPYLDNIPLQKHHIIPKYCFKDTPSLFMETSANLVLLSKEDHTKAHQILFEIYGDQRDLGAVCMLSERTETEEGLRIFHQQGAVTVHKLLKKEERNFWSKDWQEEMLAQKKADSNILAIQGKSVSKRWDGRIISEEDQIVWSFLLRMGEETLCSLWCSLGKDIDIELQKIHPSKTEVSKILSGKNKSSGGWTLKRV